MIEPVFGMDAATPAYVLATKSTRPQNEEPKEDYEGHQEGKECHV